MPRRNRVDPFGDLHAAPPRGMFTGNRGCLVDDAGEIVRHHRGRLWIACVTSYRDWRSPLADPGHWTPLFFLDDAVALAAGHRPCGLCRRESYISYQMAVTAGKAGSRPVPADELNRMLAEERLRAGRGIDRRDDRILWSGDIDSLPAGTVIVDRGIPHLVLEDTLRPFRFDGWQKPVMRPTGGIATVLTPPTSVLALDHGFVPALHDSTARIA